MSSLAQIQEAIISLPADERRALSVWLDSQNDPTFTPEDESQLLKSLDIAIRDLDAGKGVPIHEVRKRVRSWAGK